MVFKQISFRLKEICYRQGCIPATVIKSIAGNKKMFEIGDAVFVCRPNDPIEILRSAVVAPVEIDDKIFVIFARGWENFQSGFGTAPAVTIAIDSIIRCNLSIQVLFAQIEYPCDLIASRTVKSVALLNFCCGNRGVLKFNDLFSAQDISSVGFSIMMDYDFSLLLREAQLHSLVPFAHIVMPTILTSFTFVGKMCLDNIALLQNYRTITERAVIIQTLFCVIGSEAFAVGIDCDLHIHTSKSESIIFLYHIT